MINTVNEREEVDKNKDIEVKLVNIGFPEARSEGGK